MCLGKPVVGHYACEGVCVTLVVVETHEQMMRRMAASRYEKFHRLGYHCTPLATSCASKQATTIRHKHTTASCWHWLWLRPQALGLGPPSGGPCPRSGPTNPHPSPSLAFSQPVCTPGPLLCTQPMAKDSWDARILGCRAVVPLIRPCWGPKRPRTGQEQYSCRQNGLTGQNRP